MASIPLPALSVRPPEPVTNPMDQYAKALQVQGMMQQQKMGQIQLQQAQQAQKEQQILGQLMVKNKGDLNKVIQDAPDAGVRPNTVLTLQQHNLQVQDMLSKKSETDLKNFGTVHDNAAGLIQPVLDAKTPEAKDAAYQQGIQAIQKNPQMYGITDPSQMPPPQRPPDDALKTQLALHMGQKEQAAQQMKEREVSAQEMAAQARKTAADATAAKNAPLAPPAVQQLNQQLAARYQVLNPGKPLPPEFTLPANAKRQDYEDLDKALEQVEKAQGIKAQQEAAAAARASAAQDRNDKQGMKSVIGFDSKGNQIFSSAGDAKALGLKSVREVGQAEAEKVTNARSLMPLLNSTDPEDPGVLQMAKKLQDEGKLGPLAGRWNDFLAGKWGSGDPEYAAFRAKMGLSTTALMQVHVGSRGGAFMLEHFQDLANAGKMDGPTLLSALDTESKYVARKAMLPSSQQSQGSGTVMMRAPDGTTRPVPADQVEHFKSKGAQVVNQ